MTEEGPSTRRPEVSRWKLDEGAEYRKTNGVGETEHTQLDDSREIGRVLVV